MYFDLCAWVLHKAISFSMATQENNIEQIFDKKNA